MANETEKSNPREEFKELCGYFIYGEDDFPAFVDLGGSPLIWNGRRWLPAEGYCRFADNAQEIDEAEFTERLKAMNGWMPNDENRARAFCERAHKGQLRKDGVTPYAEHPKAVAKMIKDWGVKDKNPIALAYLHDVLEDTPVTKKEIELKFEIGLALEVEVLTRRKDEEKDAYSRRVAEKGGPSVLLVKCADRICNTLDFMKLGRDDYAREYFHKADIVFDALYRNAWVEEAVKENVRLTVAGLPF